MKLGGGPPTSLDATEGHRPHSLLYFLGVLLVHLRTETQELSRVITYQSETSFTRRTCSVVVCWDLQTCIPTLCAPRGKPFRPLGGKQRTWKSDHCYVGPLCWYFAMPVPMAWNAML